VGVNLVSAPEGVGYPTAVLADRFGHAVAADELMGRLMARFEEALAEWDGGESFDTIRAAWLDRAAGLGERIRVSDGRGGRDGIFEGLDPDGRLLLRGEVGIETVEAADLWILPESDGAVAAASSGSRAPEGLF
jgi:BirA family biotin operon repressor/biotin-[acetyl-CoA-carboxylase] ligase